MYESWTFEIAVKFYLAACFVFSGPVTIIMKQTYNLCTYSDATIAAYSSIEFTDTSIEVL